MIKMETINRYVTAGTIIHIGGIPFKLEEEVVVSGTPENFRLAAEQVLFPEYTNKPVVPRQACTASVSG